MIMKQIKGIRAVFLAIVGVFLLVPGLSCASDAVTNNKVNPIIANGIFDKARNNDNWKVAFTTGKNAQVVFMSITPMTNPDNEIGMETHKFDQVIFVVEGKAKSMINGKESVVGTGDMIYIPQGVPHNFVNSSASKPFKIISVYSDNDIPLNAVYKKKSDMPQE